LAAATPNRDPAPGPEHSLQQRGVQVRPERAGAPRATTDNPWRDLHPARIWPD
jgi:hypothetical protein